MSTFGGVIKEIPSIRVDYFAGKDEASLYFLSHCHTDHMVGIQRLGNVKLVVSEVSAAIISILYPNLKACLDIIDIWNEKLYILEDGSKILCQAIPAGHCPGSVMFYFQTEADINVLYTGDFRYRIKDLQQLKILQTIKTDLAAVYVDSTFLLPEFNWFPDQRESVSVVTKLIKSWIQDSNDNRIFLQIPARFGSEFLILELYKQLRMKMYISDVDHNCLLPYVPEIRNIMEPRLNDLVKIVVGRKNSSSMDPKFNWRTILPSAMYWTNFKKGDRIVKKDASKELYRICYSSHSSRSEIIEFLKLIDAKEINLNVLPEGTKDRRLMELKEFENDLERRKSPPPVIIEQSESKSAFVAGNISQAGCGKYKSILDKLRLEDDTDDEETEIMALPKRTRLD